MVYFKEMKTDDKGTLSSTDSDSHKSLKKWTPEECFVNVLTERNGGASLKFRPLPIVRFGSFFLVPSLPLGSEEVREESNNYQ